MWRWKQLFQLFYLGKMENKKAEKDKGIHRHAYTAKPPPPSYTPLAAKLSGDTGMIMFVIHVRISDARRQLFSSKTIFWHKEVVKVTDSSLLWLYSELWLLTSIFTSYKWVFLKTRGHIRTLTIVQKIISRVMSNLSGLNYTFTDSLSRCLYQSF